jgi:glycosyltransferase involved in cell wall biosynthesis
MDRLQQRYANLSRLPNQIRTETPASTVGRPPLIKLWVVGDGPEKERLTQMASETTTAREGLAVEFVGAVADVSPWWRCFDIFVLPSLDESFGLVIGEAMATGVPVIASRLPAVEEFVVDGETGLLVPAGDASALASALVRLIENSELRQQLAGQAWRYARDHLSATRMAALTESVYRELLSSGPCPKEG